jgi:hypothetical protein
MNFHSYIVVFSCFIVSCSKESEKIFQFEEFYIDNSNYYSSVTGDSKNISPFLSGGDIYVNSFECLKKKCPSVPSGILDKSTCVSFKDSTVRCNLDIYEINVKYSYKNNWKNRIKCVELEAKSGFFGTNAVSNVICIGPKRL